MRTLAGVNARNGDERRRRWILFYAGLGGMFVYLAVSTVLHDFRVEWLGAFLGMMGVSLGGTAIK